MNLQSFSLSPGDWVRTDKIDWNEYLGTADDKRSITLKSKVCTVVPRRVAFGGMVDEVVKARNVIEIPRSDFYRVVFIKRSRKRYIIVAGCRRWQTFAQARKWYRKKHAGGVGYYSAGKKNEMLAILDTLERIAKRRGLL